MQTKIILRLIFISILVLSIVYGGIYAFMKLKSNEAIYHTDLFSLIPTDSDILFYSKYPEELPDDFPVALLPEQACFKLARALCKEYRNDVNISSNNELILSYQGNEGVIFYRTTAEKIKAWEKANQEKGYFLFSPQTEEYKDVKISVYLTSDDHFFCFAYHQGAFIGSYSKNLLHKTIDMYGASETLRNNPSFTAFLKISNQNVLATCFFKKEHWTSFDISFDKDSYWINGCILPDFCTAEVYQTFNKHAGTEVISPEFIPSRTSGLIFLNTDSTWLSGKPDNEYKWNDSIVMQHTAGNVSIAYFASKDTVVNYYKACCISLKNEDIFLKELIDRINTENSGTPISIIGIQKDNLTAPVYRLPAAIKLTHCLAPFFQSDSTEVFTFYKQNILICDSEEALKVYLKEINSSHNFTENSLFKVYNESKNEHILISMLIDGNAASAHPLLCNEIIPAYFLTKMSDEKYQLFLQFSQGESLIYYTGVLKFR